ncbi:MAG: FHA domain-containing protein [Dehalococcoidia bacterium]|nr:FHA domain-containing protein [Dehalococcoidia bacterium]
METPWLEWDDGRGSRRVPVSGVVTIGRTPENTVQLGAPGVSRSHCRVSLNGGQVVVDARGSTNGIRVNGQRFESATLNPGQAFEVGGVTIRVIDGTGSGGASGPEAAARLLSLHWREGAAPRVLSLRQPATIGRTPENTIQINEPGVSRRHAKVSPGAGDVLVDARGSTNGVRVRGQRLETARLRPGEGFQVGSVEFGVGGGAGGGDRRTWGPVRMVSVAAFACVAALVAVVLAVAVFGGRDDDLTLADIPADEPFPAYPGEKFPVEPFDDTAWQPARTQEGFSVKVPPGWTLEETQDSSLVRLFPPGAKSSSQPLAISLRAVPHDFQGGTGLTEGERVPVGSGNGVLRRDKYLGLPWHEVHVSVPMDSGVLLVEAPFGPGMNLEPQMMEVLRGVEVR